MATQTAAPLPLEGRLAALPTAPGCYLMKDGEGKVIYVGKAKVLRDRVRSYFGSPKSLTPKTRELVARIADFEVVRTDTEREALLLESALIKRHLPKYNILLKDDKTYPFLKITNDEWPTVIYTRNVRDDTKSGARYFGPFADSWRGVVDAEDFAAIIHLPQAERALPRQATRSATGRAPACTTTSANASARASAPRRRPIIARVLDNVAKFLSGKSEEPDRRSPPQDGRGGGESRLRDRRPPARRGADLERVTERQKMVVPGATTPTSSGWRAARVATPACRSTSCAAANSSARPLPARRAYRRRRRRDPAIVRHAALRRCPAGDDPAATLPAARAPRRGATVEMLRARRGGAVKLRCRSGATSAGWSSWRRRARRRTWSKSA